MDEEDVSKTGMWWQQLLQFVVSFDVVWCRFVQLSHTRSPLFLTTVGPVGENGRYDGQLLVHAQDEQKAALVKGSPSLCGLFAASERGRGVGVAQTQGKDEIKGALPHFDRAIDDAAHGAPASTL
jgi:hypothetical protein